MDRRECQAEGVGVERTPELFRRCRSRRETDGRWQIDARILREAAGWRPRHRRMPFRRPGRRAGQRFRRNDPGEAATIPLPSLQEREMKLGTLKEGGRDGTLVVVSRDLARAVRATGIAATLQQALDDWQHAAPRLVALAEALEQGQAEAAFELDPAA